MKKKILSAALVLALVLCFLPMTALARDDIPEWLKNTTWEGKLTYYTDDGTGSWVTTDADYVLSFSSDGSIATLSCESINVTETFEFDQLGTDVDNGTPYAKYSVLTYFYYIDETITGFSGGTDPVFESKDAPTLVPPHVHAKGTHHEAAAATCTTAGTVEYWECTGVDCTAMLDTNGAELESIEDENNPALGHNFTGDAVSNGNGTHSLKCARENCTAVGTMNDTTPVAYSEGVEGFVSCSGGTATCSSMAVCTACGGEYGDFDANAHSFAAAWSHDATNHWHAASCVHTGEKTDVGAHVDETGDDHKCDVCGYVMSKCIDNDGDGICDICEKEMPKGFDFSGLFERIFNLIRLGKITDDIKAFSILTLILAFIRNIISAIIG